jgi:hypothetical protein
VVRYFRPIRFGFILHFIAQAVGRCPKPCFSSARDRISHAIGSKKRPGPGPRRTIQWTRPKYEQSAVRRKSSPRVLLVTFGSSDRGCIAPYGLLRAPRPTACESRKTLAVNRWQHTVRRQTEFEFPKWGTEAPKSEQLSLHERSAPHEAHSEPR